MFNFAADNYECYLAVLMAWL